MEEVKDNTEKTAVLLGTLGIFPNEIIEKFLDKLDFESRYQWARTNTIWAKMIKEDYCSSWVKQKMGNRQKKLYLHIIKKDKTRLKKFLVETGCEDFVNYLSQIFRLLKYVDPEFKQFMLDKINKEIPKKQEEEFLLISAAIYLGQTRFVASIFSEKKKIPSEYRKWLFSKLSKIDECLLDAIKTDNPKIVRFFLQELTSIFPVQTDRVYSILNNSVECVSPGVLKYLLQKYPNMINSKKFNFDHFFSNISRVSLCS